MAVCEEHLYYFQSLQRRRDNDPEVFYQPSALALLSNHTVSFDDGPPHGSWQFNSDRSVLYVTFHWNGQQNQTKEHDFQAIADTSCFVLTLRDGVLRPDAVLVPGFKEPRQPEIPGQTSPCDARAKRRRLPFY